MLQLSRAFPGAPNDEACVTFVSHNDTLFVVYASNANIILLQTPELTLHHVLPFFEAYPGLTNLEARIGSVTTDSDDTMVAASVGTQIGFWAPTSGGVWKVHSTLNVSQPVRAMHYRTARLLLTTDDGMSVWEQHEETGVVLWKKVWEESMESPPSVARLSETGSLVASACSGARTVQILDTRKKRVQSLAHPRPLAGLTWRRPTSGNRSSLTLFTVTVDGTVRIWQPVLDSPHTLRLWATLDAYSFTPSGEAALQVRWLDKATRPTEGSPLQSSDIFFGIDRKGRVGLRTVDNIERRPPTLLAAHAVHPISADVVVQAEKPTLVFPLPSTSSSSCLVMFLSPSSMKALSYAISSQLGNFDVKQGSDPIIKSTPFGKQHSSNIRYTCRSFASGGFITRAEDEIIYWDASPRSIARWQVKSDLATIVDGGVLAFSERNLTFLQPDGTSQALPLPDKSSSVVALLQDGPRVLALTNSECVEVDVQKKCVVAVTSLPKQPYLRVPVDGCNGEFLDVSQEGDLTFWKHSTGGFRRVGGLKTERKAAIMAVCSSERKSVLVTRDNEGYHLTIWNSKLSEFSSGLEYEQTFSDEILSLCWTCFSSQALAVCFSGYVLLLWPERMTYFDATPPWSSSFRVDISQFSPLPLTAATFLSSGSLVLTAGNEVYVFSSALRPDVRSVYQDLYALIASRVGPLPDWHPQMVLQCLLWNKVDRVKHVIERLAKIILHQDATSASIREDLLALSIEGFDEDQIAAAKDLSKSKHSELFDSYFDVRSAEGLQFSRPVVDQLLAALDKNPLPELTVNEQEHLEALIETTVEIDEQRRSLDANGLRYLISMRSFYILNRKSAESAAPVSTRPNNVLPTIEGRSRIRYRDMVWAYHSESQEILLQACASACGGKLKWFDARALGVFLWVHSNDVLREQMETVARNEYMSGDNRDPTTCCLYYFALGKRRLVHGLWKQAAWHPEQAVMLKFLANDFDQPRWKTAALKNAYALLGKKRYEYAAAFFLLGGSLLDAVNVCIKQLGDMQLAVAIARVVEQGHDGPVLRDLLLKTVIPLAFKEDNRWLGSWAFWMLRKRDLAVRIIMTPLTDLAATLDDVRIESVGTPIYDDPSLAILFSYLKAKTLQAAKGTSQIPEQSEFNFVLQMARVFCRMGCHTLALDLVKSWSFDRPTAATVRRPDTVNPGAKPTAVEPPRPPVRRGSMFTLAGRRKSSLLIDVDIPSLPATRPSSPGLPDVLESPPPVEDAAQAREDGIGSLMRSAKQDTKVPEFNMDAFF